MRIDFSKQPNKPPLTSQPDDVCLEESSCEETEYVKKESVKIREDTTHTLRS